MRIHITTFTFFRFLSINLIFLFGINLNTEAQQVSMVDHYYINPSIYNPAAVGYNKLLEAYILRNSKFKDFNGGQTFHALTIGTGLKEGKYGVGINLLNNSIDVFNSTQIDFSYSYRMKIDDSQHIRLGLSAGISDFRLNLSKKNADMNDELLQAGNYNNTEFVANFGAYYTNKNLIIALAIPQLINQSNLSKYDGDDLYRQSRHYLLSGSYEIPVRSIKDLSFVPNFMMRFMKNSPLQYDLNAQLKLKNKGWLSVNYRNKYAIGLNIGVIASESLKIGYSYNVNTQNSAHISATNHEFLIGYTFRKKSNKEQNHKSEELIFLKDLLEDKYDRINKLEEELRAYASDKKIKSRGQDHILTKGSILPKSKPISKIDNEKINLNSDDSALADDNVVYTEELVNTFINRLNDKGRKHIRIKNNKSIEHQSISVIDKNKTDASSDTITFADSHITYDEKQDSLSNNELINEDDIPIENDEMVDAQYTSTVEKEVTDLSSDTITFAESHITYDEEKPNPSNTELKNQDDIRIENEEMLDSQYTSTVEKEVTDLSSDTITFAESHITYDEELFIPSNSELNNQDAMRIENKETIASQYTSAVEKEATDLSPDTMTFVDSNITYDEEVLISSNNELKGQNDIPKKNEELVDSQYTSALEQNATDLSYDTITFADIDVIHNNEVINPSNNKLKNQEDDTVLIEDDIFVSAISISESGQNGVGVGSDDVTLTDSNIEHSEESSAASNNDYTIHEVGRIELDKNQGNLFFEFGKSDLSETSKRKANEVALLMKKYDSYILKLYGFSDDTRSPSLNSVLANKRLEVVYNYLVKDPTLEGRIIIMPHEEEIDSPVNTTKQNKKSSVFNRRVFLEMYSYD